MKKTDYTCISSGTEMFSVPGAWIKTTEDTFAAELKMCGKNRAVFKADVGEAWLHVLEAEASQGFRSLYGSEGMTALEVGCVLEGAEPLFGYQKELAQQKGLSFILKFKDTYPAVSIYQHKEWWMRPFFTEDLNRIPEKSQCILRKRKSDYEVFLAVSAKHCRVDLEGTQEGVFISLSSNCAGMRKLNEIAFVYGTGRDPYRLISDMVSYALFLTGKELKLREEKKFPDVFKKWGWCTWDSLGQNVSEAAIIEKMEDFRSRNIKVPWILIDDGWSKVNRETKTLESFQEDLERFPNGLHALIRVLKDKYGVEHVGVWQAAKGYWNGVEAGSQVWQETAAFLRTYPGGDVSVAAEPEGVFGFWDKWHSRLSRAGVSFIKMDGQSSFSLSSRGVISCSEAARALHKGIEASADLHFNGNLINCMGMAPEDFWNRSSAVLSRSSDDYTPTVPGSFAEHALQNAFNSILQGCLYWGDWDMVWTTHEESRESIMLRAISGGPFYISDGTGSTTPEEIAPVAAEDGTILRCEDVGRPTLDCLTDPHVLYKNPLKIYNRCRGIVYVAAFLDRTVRKREGVLEMESIPGLSKNGCYWVYHQQEKRAELVREGFCGFEIPFTSAAMLSIVPADQEISPVGMIDKYISIAGVRVLWHSKERWLIRCECSGTLGFLSEQETFRVRIYHKDGNITEKILHRKESEYLLSIPDLKEYDLAEISRE